MKLVMALHRLSEKPDFFDENLGNVISTKSLKGLIDRFRRYSFVGIETILESQNNSENLMSLTFDDGNSSVYNLAFPFLYKQGIPFSIFINSSNTLSGEPHWFEILEAGIRISNRKSLVYDGEKLSLEDPLSRLESLKKIKSSFKQIAIKREGIDAILNFLGVPYDYASEFAKKRDCILPPSEIRKLSEGGIEIGSHGRKHQILTRIPKAEQDEEITNSKREIEEITQKECRYFSYPNGWVTDYNPTIIGLLKRRGYRGAFAARTSLAESEIQTTQNRYEILRWCPSESSLRDLLNH